MESETQPSHATVGEGVLVGAAVVALRESGRGTEPKKVRPLLLEPSYEVAVPDQQSPASIHAMARALEANL